MAFVPNGTSAPLKYGVVVEDGGSNPIMYVTIYLTKKNYDLNFNMLTNVFYPTICDRSIFYMAIYQMNFSIRVVPRKPYILLPNQS